MKAKELMTGNWVTGNDGKPTQVMNVLVEAVLTTDGQGLDERCGEITPIEITEEMLERNGFEAMEPETPWQTKVWMYSFGRFDSVSYVPEKKRVRVKLM